MGLIAVAIPESLDEATGQRIPLAGFMAGAAVIGMVGLLSPVPVLRHLGRRLVGFAAIVAATAWGVLWGLLYAQRIPERVSTDLGGQAELEFRPNEPEMLLEPIRDARTLYESFFLALLIGVLLSGLHYAMRRVRHAR